MGGKKGFSNLYVGVVSWTCRSTRKIYAFPTGSELIRPKLHLILPAAHKRPFPLQAVTGQGRCNAGGRNRIGSRSTFRGFFVRRARAELSVLGMRAAVFELARDARPRDIWLWDVERWEWNRVAPAGGGLAGGPVEVAARGFGAQGPQSMRCADFSGAEGAWGVDYTIVGGCTGFFVERREGAVGALLFLTWVRGDEEIWEPGESVAGFRGTITAHECAGIGIFHVRFEIFEARALNVGAVLIGFRGETRNAGFSLSFIRPWGFWSSEYWMNGVSKGLMKFC